MLQKYYDNLLHLCATCKPQNADNARTFGILFSWSWQTPLCLCNKRVHHWQKVTTMFVI